MGKTDKMIKRMRHNPAADWVIADVQRLCEALGWPCLPPSGGGSHWKVGVPGSETILTIPARRPIKPIYIRKLMELLKDDDDGQAD